MLRAGRRTQSIARVSAMRLNEYYSTPNDFINLAGKVFFWGGARETAAKANEMPPDVGGGGMGV